MKKKVNNTVLCDKKFCYKTAPFSWDADNSLKVAAISIKLSLHHKQPIASSSIVAACPKFVAIPRKLAKTTSIRCMIFDVALDSEGNNTVIPPKQQAFVCYNWIQQQHNK